MTIFEFCEWIESSAPVWVPIAIGAALLIAAMRIER